MSITATQLTTGGAASGTSFTTASISPTPGRLILVSVGSDRGAGLPNTPTISGCNMTWTLILSRADSGSARRESLFRGLSTNPSSGALTIDFAGQDQGNGGNWSVTEFHNIDLSGTNGSAAIVQSASNTANTATSLTVTLGAFSNVNNATFGSIFKNGNETINGGSGFTVLGQNNAVRSIQAQWKASNDTTCEWTWSTGHVVIGIAVELKEKTYDVLGGMI